MRKNNNRRSSYLWLESNLGQIKATSRVVLRKLQCGSDAVRKQSAPESTKLKDVIQRDCVFCIGGCVYGFFVAEVTHIKPRFRDTKIPCLYRIKIILNKE